MKVIKRNQVEVDFDITKIIKAISKANLSVSENERLSEDDIKNIATLVEDKCHELVSTDISVEKIQDIVIGYLMDYNKRLAMNYTTYRYEHALMRQGEQFDRRILAIIDGENEVAKQENSNKNPVIVSTQRDYMAGEMSRSLVEKYFMDPDLIDAHNKGMIHIHDTDYISQKVHNCFTGGTKFITNYGIRQFKDFVDGASVYVKDLHGVLRLATVHNYGKQNFNEVTLRSGKHEKTVRCTPNHRWVLLDGSVTTSLNVGDRLWLTEDSTNLNICSYEQAMAWCMGFIIGDGYDHVNATQVRLCGPKNKYKNIFELAGFSVSEKLDNGDVIMRHFNASKQAFLNGFGWRYMHPEYQALAFKGLYCADGATKANKIVTSDTRVCSFIEETSGLAGYYISSSRDYTHSTNFKENAYIKEYYFSKSTPINLGWTVVGIKSLSLVGDAWCVEEPVTHTFTLEGGVVTGNCDLINLEDMLQNDTVISGVLIEKPKSFSTACNVTTQIIAQVASSQLGGQTFTLTHLAPFVDISRQKIYNEIENECSDAGITLTQEQIDKIAETRLRKEIKTGVQMIQYQIVTLMTTNGQAPFCSVFMYLNETNDPKLKKDLAMIIEEVLRQRYIGVKNEKGVWITPAFPKLLYVLEPDNITEDSEYWYLTELAAKCTAKRLVPDYISEKKMKEMKEGDCFPCMGCRSFLSVYKDPETGKSKYYGRLTKMLRRPKIA